MTFIVLHKKDSDTPVVVNVDTLEAFANHEIWLSGKRYKVKETAMEILNLIHGNT